MFVQAHMMIGMASTNESKYGKMNYVSASFDNVDFFLFPLTEEEKGLVLAVACVKPYSIETIKRAVSVMVAL
jgi:hypothetical protein